jgi:hypothetical protein
LSVSTRSIDTWVGKRMIPCIRITPRFYLYNFETVLAADRKHYQVDAAQGGSISIYWSNVGCAPTGAIERDVEM